MIGPDGVVLRCGDTGREGDRVAPLPVLQGRRRARSPGSPPARRTRRRSSCARRRRTPTVSRVLVVAGRPMLLTDQTLEALDPETFQSTSIMYHPSAREVRPLLSRRGSSGHRPDVEFRALLDRSVTPWPPSAPRPPPTTSSTASTSPTSTSSSPAPRRASASRPLGPSPRTGPRWSASSATSTRRGGTSTRPGPTGVDLYEADLASLASIRAFTDTFLADGHDRIDVLDRQRRGSWPARRGPPPTASSCSSAPTTSGHFVLVNRLLPLLLTGTPARIVIAVVGRAPVQRREPRRPRLRAHALRPVDRLRPGEDRQRPLRRRARPAPARLVACGPRRCTPAGSSPSWAATSPTRRSARSSERTRRRGSVEWKTVPQGAATSVWAGFVADADEVGGRYCEDCAVSPVVDDPNESPGVMGYALDPDRRRAVDPVRGAGRRDLRPVTEVCAPRSVSGCDARATRASRWCRARSRTG